MRPLRYLALCLLLLLPCGSKADTIGPAQAQALQLQLKDWLSGLLGPAIALPDLPLQIDADGDHYRVTIPIAGLSTAAGAAVVTAAVHPLDGGRWAIDDVQVPGAANFTMTLPDTGDNGPGGPTKVDLHFGKQDMQAVIDPALATASTMQVEVHNVAVVSDSPKQHQEQRIDLYQAHGSLKPTADGTLDLDMAAAMQGWQTAARVGGNAGVSIGAQQFNAIAQIGGVSRERVSAIMAAMTGMLAGLPADAVEKSAKTQLTPASRAQLRKLIEALNGVFRAIRLEESLDGLQVEIAGMGGVSMRHFLLGFGGDAPEGKLHAWLDIGLDGINSPNLPPKAAAFLPRHFALRPSLSGVQTADLAKLALDASSDDPDNQDLDPDIAAIFAHGGVDLGIEALAFDLGPATVEGKGHLTVLSPDSWRGEARVTATGLDDLANQARSNSDLQQALPFLVMLRGLARPDGKRLIWDIASENGSVTVNGLDLSQLGGDKSKPKSPGSTK